MALRRTLIPGLAALRAQWRTSVLLVATSAIGLAALLTVTSLVAPSEAGLSTRLALAPLRGGDLDMRWSAFAWSPTVTRHAALLTLFRLLVGVAAGGLAVAWLTVVSLFAVRASERAPELTLRRAVGASRRDLVAAGLFESGAVAAGALLCGSGLGAVSARLAAAAWVDAVAPATPAANIVAVVAAIGGIALGATLPVAFPRRSSVVPSPSGKPLALLVPALQLGLSLTVLTTAALLQRAAGRLMAAGPAAPLAGHVLELTTAEPRPGARATQYASLLHRFGSGPGFDAVSLTSPGTLVGLGLVDVVTTDCGKCWQGGLAYQLQPVPATHYLVSADTFRVLGLSVTAGRGITGADRWGADHVAVVSRSLATRHFQQGEAVGRQILVRGARHTVVGVVEDQRPAGFGGALQPPEAVYLSVLQHPARAVDLLVRAPASMTPVAMARRLRDTVRLRGAKVVGVSASRLTAQEAARVRWFADLFGVEGWLILTLATLGTFVVMRLWVASWLYELGLRRAVGARRRDILTFVLVRAAGVAIGGVAIGLWVGLVAWGMAATVVAGVPAWDLHAALRIAPLLIIATLAGALLPAWRAARAVPTALLGTGSG